MASKQELERRVATCLQLLRMADTSAQLDAKRIYELEQKVQHLEDRLSTGVTKEILLLEKLIQKDDVIKQLTTELNSYECDGK